MRMVSLHGLEVVTMEPIFKLLPFICFLKSKDISVN
jgi:hypothetical protein